MALVIERKLFATGDSLAITIPKDWTKQFGLKAGANVEIVLGDELVIRAKAREDEKSRFYTDLTERK